MSSRRTPADLPDGYRPPSQEWTVGRLRLALAGVPDRLPIRVLVAVEPGGDVAVQVVHDADVVDQAAIEASPATGRSRWLWFEICCDYPHGPQQQT